MVPLSGNIWVFSVVKVSYLALMVKNSYFKKDHQVLYSVGYNSIAYLINIALIRGSSLQQRAWFLALAASPSLIASFSAPPIAEKFLGHCNFFWGIATLVGVTLIFCASMSRLIFKPTSALPEPRAGTIHNNTDSLTTQCIKLDGRVLSLSLMLFKEMLTAQSLWDSTFYSVFAHYPAPTEPFRLTE
jgi:hypothetical protein